MNADKLARIASIILGPHTWLPVLFVLMILNAELSFQQLRIVFPVILLFQVVVPIAYLTIAPKLGWVRKWDMETKEERKPLFAIMFVLSLITLGIIYTVGNLILLKFCIIFVALLTTLFAITWYWKISLHVSLNVAAVLLIHFLFGPIALPLYLVIPIIFWARLQLKKHTVAQLVAGLIVTTTITVGGFAFFKLN